MIDRSNSNTPTSKMETILPNGGFKEYHRTAASANSPPQNGRSSPTGRSPVSSPPSSPPRGSPFGANPPPFPAALASGLPHGALPPGVFLPPNYLHRTPDYLNLSLGAGGADNGHPFSRSPSYNMVSPNDPTANACKIVDFHGEKIASFNIHGKTMLCLPQESLKHVNDNLT